MKYNEIVERHAPILGLNNLVTGEPCKPFVYMDYVDDGMWVHYVTYCENICKQKRKRCLTMADWCEVAAAEMKVKHDFDTVNECKAFYYHRELWWRKWKNRWLELAEKFKDKEA